MISREQYKKIKSMKREEMDAYLDSMFAQGHNNGVVALSSVMVQKIDAGLRKTPGIGEKRYEEIMKNITEALAEDNEGVEVSE